MNAVELAENLCRDLVRGVATRGGREFIVTPFRYANGDFINVYVSNDGHDSVLSDMGATLHRLGLNGVGVTEARDELISHVIALHGLGRERGVFTKRVSSRTLGSDFVSFCAALTRLSNLEFDSSSRRESPIPGAVENVVRRLIDPVRRVTRNWVDEAIDPAGAYSVDYHINSDVPPRNLFVVTTREKGIHVASVCNFLRSRDRSAPAMAVIDGDVVRGKPLRQLELAVDELCYGVEGKEGRIVSFAVGRPLGFQLQDSPD